MRYLGIGSPLVDLLAQVDDAFLREHIPGAKGGMEMVSGSFIRDVTGKLAATPLQAAGGSAGNTIFALAEMGSDVAMLGKLGADAAGDFFRRELRRLGGSDREFIIAGNVPTGSCLSLVTPDAERTMRSDLGASLLLNREEAAAVDYRAYDLVYIEGYMLFSPVFDTVLECASAAGCRIALDLASFEVAGTFRNKLLEVLPRCVDIVFANAEEAAALFPETAAPAACLARLADFCGIAVVKLGRDGAVVRRGDETVSIPARLVDAPVDTTAAGDYWAAGFLYGLERGYTLEKAADAGALLAGEIVKVMGGKLPPAVWQMIHAELAALA